MFNRLFRLATSSTYQQEKTSAPEPEQEPEPLAVATGSLYVSTPNAENGPEQKCMYYSCAAKIRPTARQHHYELFISRDDEAEDDPTQPADIVFPVETAANFKCAEGQCAWSDRYGKRYSFDIDEEGVARFEENIGKALFESVFEREPEDKDADEVKRMAQAREEVEEKPTDVLVTAGELVRVEGVLYQYNVDTSNFEILADEVVATVNAAVVQEDGSRAYVLIVSTTEGAKIIECELNNDMNGQFFAHTLSVVWVLNLRREEEAKEQLCLSLKMEEAEEFVRFRNQYSVCLYEVNHQASMDDLKLKDYDRSYIERSEWDDVEPMEVEEQEEEQQDERTIRDEGERAAMEDVGDGELNSQLAVSANTDRTFVVRGKKMGVFHTGNDGVEHRTTIEFKDPTRHGETFAPSTVMLHEQDHSMLLLDPRDQTKMMRMDLERQEIVDTWSGPVTKSTPVSALHRVAKYANLTTTQEFVGLNKNALLRMDPRTREFIVQTKKYAPSTRAKLDCVATTGSGHLAVASENGDIRLYDTIGKNAKTHLPGLGDKIIGIDVSEDGNYVLATTAKYLLVINTVVQGTNTYSGFTKSMGKHKPTPRKLVIRPEDVVRHRMGQISFTPAHFNTGHSLERSIVTSSGPFLITWSFRSVKLGRLDNYKIARYEDDVVADDFAYNDDGKIVVTMPNDVRVATRR